MNICINCGSKNLISGQFEIKCEDCGKYWLRGAPECSNPKCRSQILREGVCVVCKRKNKKHETDQANAIVEVITGLLPEILCYEGEEGYGTDDEEELIKMFLEYDIAQLTGNLNEILISNRESSWSSQITRISTPLSNKILYLANKKLKGNQLTQAHFRYHAREFMKFNWRSLIFINPTTESSYIK